LITTRGEAVPALFSKQVADGPGRPVVLSHALGLDHTMWASTVRAWEEQRPVLVYDHRGHGRSAAPAGPYSMDDFVADAAQVVRTWNRGPVIWIGLSMGGMAGQGLAIRHPELVGGLVLAHTVARYAQPARQAWEQRIRLVNQGGMAAVVDLVLQRYLTDAVRAAQPQLVARLRDRILACDPGGYAAACAAVGAVDWLDLLPSIQCPTLVLAGELDAGATPAMAREIQERIGGARFRQIAAASHLSPLEQPQSFTEAVEDFLGSLGAL
jgi:3-oxoadipate enol-lactonase